MQVRNRQIYEFDDFRLDADEQFLLRRGEPVALHGKAFELLLVLVRHRGRLLTKDEMFSLVWPDQIVEESNLTVNMSAIRKALGERASAPRYIQTVSGRGYRFTGEVREAADDGEGEELIIERESFTRVIVEEDENGTGKSLPAEIASALPARAGEKVSTRTRALLLAALIGALLAAGAGGFWLYQSRSRDGRRQAAGVPAPAQPATMHRFTTAGGLPLRVAISRDGKSLVYQQRSDGKDSLWLGQIETNSSVMIHRQPGLLYGRVAFSPDGSHIYYFTVQDGGSTRSKLLRMPVVGGAASEVASDIHGCVTFSPGGERIAFVRRDEKTRRTSIVLADATDGRNESALAAREWPESFSGELAWSPDGRTIAAVTDSAGGPDGILAVSVADGGVSKVGDTDWGGLGDVAWLADGSGLVAVGRVRLGQWNRQIWLVSYPEGSARKITNDLNHYTADSLSVSADGKLAVLQGVTSPSVWIAPAGDARRARAVLEGTSTRQEGLQGLAWTPAGRLLYVATVGDRETLWEMNTDGGDHRQLVLHDPRAFDHQMRATADGRYVVFHSNRSGQLEVWRAAAGGGDLKQLTAGGGNSQPSLSPDSRSVIYTSERDGRRTLWHVSIDGGGATQLTDKPSSWPQVSPDGSFIAYVASPDPPAPPPFNPSGREDARLEIMPLAGGEPVKSFAVAKTALLGSGSLAWTPDGKAIMYKDSIQGLWRQTLDGGEPQPVKGFEEIRLYNLAWSPDGQSLAYTTGSVLREIVLIENFR